MSTVGQTQNLGLDLGLTLDSPSPERITPSVLCPQPLWLPPLGELLQALGHPSLLLLNTEIKRKKTHFSDHSSGERTSAHRDSF